MAESGLLLPGRLELIPIGAVAQLGARKTGSLEVRGSIPLSSTKFSHRSDSPKNHFLLFLLIEKIPVREIIGRNGNLFFSRLFRLSLLLFGKRTTEKVFRAGFEG